MWLLIKSKLWQSLVTYFHLHFLLQALNKALAKCLDSYSSPDEDLTPARISSLHRIETILTDGLSQSLRIVSASSAQTLQEIFFNTQTYHKHMLTVYKTCVLCRTVQRLGTCGSHIGELKAKCEFALTTLQSNLTVNRLPPIVQQIFKIFCSSKENLWF